jgi:hypothetical protein
MKNAIAIIIGAVIISATVSVVQGQGRFGGGSCKNPVSLHGEWRTSFNDNAGNWICDNKVYLIRPMNDRVHLMIWDIEEGTVSKKRFIEVD